MPTAVTPGTRSMVNQGIAIHPHAHIISSARVVEHSEVSISMSTAHVPGTRSMVNQGIAIYRYARTISIAHPPGI